MLSYIPNHVEIGLGRMIAWLRNSPNLMAFLRLLLEEVQELEDAMIALILERSLNTATGAQLDQYGELVGQLRGGLSDKDYRRFLKVRIRANRSCGQPGTIAWVLSELTGVAVRYGLLVPAAFSLSFTANSHSTALIRSRIRKLLQAISPAGVLLAEINESTPGSWGFEGDEDALELGEGFFTTEVF